MNYAETRAIRNRAERMDEDYILHARDDVFALLDEVKRLRGVVALATTAVIREGAERDRIQIFAEEIAARMLQSIRDQRNRY